MSAPEFPFPLTAMRGGELNARFGALRRDYSATGDFPVILGDAESVERLMEAYEFNTEAAVAPGALDFDVLDWFEARVAEDPEAFYALEDEDEGQVSPPMTALTPGFDHRGVEKPEVWIARIPADHSWLLPVELKYGAWNACPGPEEHAAIARYWGEKYGAEIAVMTSDTIEFTVSRPPQTPEECANLAREQYIYCTDIVDQGVGSVEALAKSLMGSTVWFFWWD